MADLKTLCIDGECRNVPQGIEYTAGENLQLSGTEFSLKSSPALKGTPTTPSISDKSTSSTQVANTAFVQGAINRRIPASLKTVVTKTVSSLANNSQTQVDILTTSTPGIYIGTIQVNYPSNATGMRWLQPNVKVSGSWSNIACAQRYNALSGGATVMTSPIVVDDKSSYDITNIGCILYQNSGAALSNVVVTFRYIFIPA